MDWRCPLVVDTSRFIEVRRIVSGGEYAHHISWSVVPRAYSLRHGGNYAGDGLRNWDLQASVDGINWILLRRY